MPPSAHPADALQQASDPTTDPDRLDELLRTAQHSRNPEVEIAIAKNPNARLATLHRVRGCLACHLLQNPSLPLHELSGASSEDEAYRLYSLRLNLARWGDDQARIAEAFLSIDRSYTAAIAGNPHTPLWMLRQLVEHGERSVVVSLASNPSAPTDVLVRLEERVRSCDGSWGNVAHALATNDATPPEVLDQLARYESPQAQVKTEIVRHPSVWPSTLHRLAVEGDANVVAVVASYAALPETLALVATHSYSTARMRVAKNKATSLETLRELVRDSCGEVRSTAAMALMDRGVHRW